MTAKLPTCLAVIPARGGSKGIADKNIKPFAGSSLLAIAIECAAGARFITKVIVSTDSERIADHAKAAGGDVPFLRPDEISGDEVPIWPVCEHAGRWYRSEHGEFPEFIMVLQPTSPLRSAEHLDKAIRKLSESDADALMSVTEAEHSPYKMRTVKDGLLHEFLPGQTVGQRQEAPPVYRLNGVVYIVRWNALCRTQSLWGDKTLAYELPEDVAMNIDTPLEFEIAEFLYKRRANGIGRVEKNDI